MKRILMGFGSSHFLKVGVRSLVCVFLPRRFPMPRGWNQMPNGWWQFSLRGPRPPSEAEGVGVEWTQCVNRPECSRAGSVHTGIRVVGGSSRSHLRTGAVSQAVRVGGCHCEV